MNAIAQALASPLDFAISREDKAIYEKDVQAVAAGDVLLAYQPIVAARSTDRPAYYEGLIRILDEDHTILPAADFIQAVETRPVGRVLDMLALKQGLHDLAEHPDIRIAINMSARSIGYPGWIQTLNQGLARDKSAAERLILEITESSAVLMPDLVTTFMADMHRRGIAFALDDFGAGYTAFRYLKDFLFDIVKIDRQFIINIDEDADNQVLASALISVGHHFDMMTVAEGVETPAEAAFLIETGFDCLQGYYFGMPTTDPVWMDQEQQRKVS